MIKITRLSKPDRLERNKAQWTEELCAARRQYYHELEDYNNGRRTSKPSKPNAIKSRYAHQDIKTVLETMFGSKCAYCESSVTAVSYQHVEHFRPQSIYPKLAYDWNNLLLACPRCNSGHKKAQFPLMDGSQPVENITNACLLDDNDDNALIDPCRDEPEEYFDFQDEWLVCRGNNSRARHTRDICGLNRDDLRRERKKSLYPVEIAAKTFLLAKKRGNLKIQQLQAEALKEYINASANYSAMAKAKIITLGINLVDLESIS
jgi:uncharacterized protein (TIGR02646 family)